MRDTCPECGGPKDHRSKICRKCNWQSSVSTSVTARWWERAGPEYIVDENGCWIWQRGLRDGWGRKMVSGVRYFAHRLYYERHRGPIPAGWHVHHKCRVRACVNPDHLEALPPERHGHGVSREIVEHVLASDASNHELSRRLGISRRTVARIRRKRP